MYIVSRYASDCSGADSPLVALRGICRYMAENSVSSSVRVDYKFASELAEAKGAQKFLAQNLKPDILFLDVTAGVPREGWGQLRPHVLQHKFLLDGFNPHAKHKIKASVAACTPARHNYQALRPAERLARALTLSLAV